MPRKNISANAYLSEYVYDLIWNLTSQEKLSIHRKYWKLFHSSVRARNFADFSTLEQKMEFFSEIGVEYALIISKEKLDNKNGLKKVMQMYKDDLNAGAVKEISKLKTYVVTDRDTAFLLSLMSQTIHHQSYFLNQELNKTAYHIKNWKKNELSPEGKDLRDSFEAADLIDRTLSNCSLTIDLVPSILGITSMDLKLLLYLNKWRHKYTSKEQVQQDLAGYNKKKISTALKRLLLNGYVVKYPDAIVPKYTVSTKGINTVSDFRKLILKQNNFD